jgi:hypothetical protein
VPRQEVAHDEEIQRIANATAARRQISGIGGTYTWPGQDSNLRATDYESAALTN